MQGWILRRRASLYVLVNGAVLLASVFGMMSNDASAGVVTYTCVLFMLASVPMLWMERINDRYALLAVFMGTYFLFFGALSLRNTVLGSDLAPVTVEHDAFMTAAQFAVILGAALVLVAYRFGCHLIRPAQQNGAAGDFANFWVLGIGLIC